MIDPKILAIHLPAYHEISENDKWWGKGFTEWNNVRSGVPFFTNHYQPKVPYHHYYYDLSRIDDLRHQFELANNYKIYGFIFYHYWFDKNRLLFEKPAEMLLNSNIQGHFCFCWANETWKTTWHGMNPQTLIEQNYGKEDEWKAHLDYLIPFFKDERYIKRDNKPVFFIYNASAIPDFDNRIKYFNEQLKDYGFSGIYIVEYISSKNRRLFGLNASAVTEFEPLYTTFFDISKANLCNRFFRKKLGKIDYQEYEKLWKYNLKRKRTYSGLPIFRSCFVDWDNSARKGKDSMIVRGANPAVFGNYLNKLMESTRKDLDNEYIVINAWNEWSEGAYLEPDMLNGFGYLEACKACIERYQK